VHNFEFIHFYAAPAPAREMMRQIAASALVRQPAPQH
jgi:hypothetical protein